MVRALRDDGSKVADSLPRVAGLDFENAEKRAGVVMVRIELKDQHEFLARALRVATCLQETCKLEPNVVEGRTQPQGSSKFVKCVFGSFELHVGLRHGPVKVGDLATTVRVIARLGVLLCTSHRSDPAPILAELVAGDGEVQRRLQVGAILFESLLEAATRLGQATAQVIDHAELVEDVWVPKPVANEPLKVRLREFVLGPSVVLVGEFEALIGRKRHRRS